MGTISFRYTPTCSAPKCGRTDVYKIAAPWSNGISLKFKSYGLACQAHDRDGVVILDHPTS